MDIRVIDTAVAIPGRGLYVFSGDQVSRYTGRWSPAPGYPVPITTEFPGAFPRNIEAALLHPDGSLYLFRGSQHLRYDLAAWRPYLGYPRPYAADWPGVFPDRVDTAVTWGPDVVYLFRDQSYTSFSPRLGRARGGFPKPIAGNWPGLGSGPVRAAFSLDGSPVVLVTDTPHLLDTQGRPMPARPDALPAFLRARAGENLDGDPGTPSGSGSVGGGAPPANSWGARAGGWNAGDREVTGTWRMPITGLHQGLSRQAPDDDVTGETREARHCRGIAIVPQTVQAGGLEVMLHFHGYDIGDREREQSGDGMHAGTVRDVAADRIPQQLAASGRNMIAIVPQGTRYAKFAIPEPDAYVTEVLGQVAARVKARDPRKDLDPLARVRTIVSAHSGGGVAAVAAVQQFERPVNNDQDWLTQPGLLLFDAINGVNELAAVTKLVVRWLNADRDRLLAQPSIKQALDLLCRRGLRFRSTWTEGVYRVVNSPAGGRRFDGKERRHQRGKTVVVNVTYEVKPDHTVQCVVDQWFTANQATLDPHVWGELRKQYVVEHMEGEHHFTLGIGRVGVATEPVNGVTHAKDTPRGSNLAPADANGNLWKALSALGPDPACRQPPPPAASGSTGYEFEFEPPFARQAAPAAPAAPPRQPPGSYGEHGDAKKAADRRYVVYQDVVRWGGTMAWRTNNPGNMKFSTFSKAHGAIAGVWKDQAVFPDLETALKALHALLKTQTYKVMTIREAITRFAPPEDGNDTEQYIADVTKGTGLPDDTVLAKLTDDQLELVVKVIRRTEGFVAGQILDRNGPGWVRDLLGPDPATAPAAPAGDHEAGSPAGTILRAVKAAIARRDFTAAGGSAFWLLNGLNAAEIVTVVRRLTRAERAQLWKHVADAAGLFDLPRLRVALAVADTSQARGVKAVAKLDALRGANPPSPVRTAFADAVAAGQWPAAWRTLTGLNMYEMVRALDAIGDDRRAQLLANRPADDIARPQYAVSVVQDRQLPATAPGDLDTTGQVATAADYLAEQLFHVAAVMNPDAMRHISRLLQACVTQGITDKSHVAYVLASAQWESHMGALMVEVTSGTAYEGRTDLGNTHPGDGVRYKGRGYVQITGRRNYQQYTDLLGVDLIAHPERATDAAIAARICTDGMANGRFTGKRLDQFGTDGSYDFGNARQIVNGHDQAAAIAGIGHRYRAVMNRP